MDLDGRPFQSEEEKVRKAAIEAEKKASEPQFEQTYDGVPYAEIVKALVELMGGAPAHGARNNFIYREACLLRYICNSEAAWIKEVILTFGEKWEKAIEDFIEWSVKYDLWCKMRFFGMKMEEAIDSDRRLVNHSGPSNLLAFVPDTFSLVDIQAVYQMQGKKGRLTALLAMWAKRGHYGTPMAA